MTTPATCRTSLRRVLGSLRVTTEEVTKVVLTFDQKREMVWGDFFSGLISEVRLEEMLRQIGYQEDAARRAQ